MSEPKGKNTYGANRFRRVIVRCSQCQCRKETNMQCDTGRYLWECDACGETTQHTVREVDTQ